MFGHRPDGKRLKGTDPIVTFTPHLMPMRCDAQVFLEHRLDFEKLSRYIAKKSVEGERVTFMQIIVAAYVRGVSQNPEVNRFIFNKQYFARNNCSAAYTILMDPQDFNSAENSVRVSFDLTDTLFDVRDRMNAAVEKARGETGGGDFLIKFANGLLKVPGLATSFVAIYRLLDRYGIPPKALMQELPFYCGMFITNNGSIGLHHVWHHIYNFGNVSMFIGMGSVIRERTIDDDGKVKTKRWLPMGLTIDERVCSGAHYSAFFSTVIKCLENPELLEIPPESVRFDEGVEYHVPKINKA